MAKVGLHSGEEILPKASTP